MQSLRSWDRNTLTGYVLKGIFIGNLKYIIGSSYAKTLLDETTIRKMKAIIFLHKDINLIYEPFNLI